MDPGRSAQRGNLRDPAAGGERPDGSSRARDAAQLKLQADDLESEQPLLVRRLLPAVSAALQRFSVTQ